MTPEVLRELVAGGERLDVKLKGEEARAISDSDLVETVVCLANRPGGDPGWLLVGVEDDGQVTGARPRHHDRTDPGGHPGAPIFNAAYTMAGIPPPCDRNDSPMASLPLPLLQAPPPGLLRPAPGRS